MRKLEDTQSYKLSFKGENVYIGLDVHLKQWHICVRTRHISKKPFSQLKQTPGHYAPILTGSSLKRPTTRHTSVASAASPPTANC